MSVSQKSVDRVGADSFRLPRFLTRRNKWWFTLFTFVPAAFIYFLANHAPVNVPIELPMTWVDRAMPFVPWTVWVYISEYLLFAVCIVVARARDQLSPFFYAFVALQCTSVLIFFLYPTVYPRHLFPLEGEGFLYQSFAFLRTIDAPTNCFPSLHVGSCYLLALMFWEKDKIKFWTFFTWASLVAISTLTTKQHYLVDIFGGAFFALFFYVIFFRLARYRN